MIHKILEYVKHPTKIFVFLQNRCNFRVLPDKPYLQICYRVIFGKKLNLKNPQTFNEKLQWLKLYDRKPEYTKMVDKYEAKRWVSERIGEKYVIPCYGVWERFEDIDFQALPEQFVLKCTHDCGGLVIVKKKRHFHPEEAKPKIERSLRKNYYFSGREWPYKHVKPRIIAEKYMEDGATGRLDDYKVLCFNGEPKLIEVHRARFTDGHTQDFYDTNWNLMPFQQLNEVSGETIAAKPKNLETMLDFCRVLSKGLPQLRVDWYEVNGSLFFGELTFFDGSGFYPFVKDEYDHLLGSWITLPTQEE